METTYDTSTPELQKLFAELNAANTALKKAINASKKSGEYPEAEMINARNAYWAYWNAADAKKNSKA